MHAATAAHAAIGLGVGLVLVGVVATARLAAPNRGPGRGTIAAAERAPTRSADRPRDS